MLQVSPDTSASSHVRKKRRRRRQEILHAALRAFREEGYHGTSLGDIAGRLGLQKTALYHYFPDKESLLYECHCRSLDELERAVEESRGGEDEAVGGATERLAHLIREHVRIVIDVLEGSPLAFEVPALSTERKAEVVARRDRYETEVRGVIERGLESGEFRSVDPKIATFAILGAINWIGRWYQPDRELDAPELGARFAAHLVGALACGDTEIAPPPPGSRREGGPVGATVRSEETALEPPASGAGREGAP